ncbi:MAG: ferritin family protein [Deltaproteobacteria bacterium]|nr:ferritin family protein [Deltaproteobacteria bacterium]
MLTLAQAIRNAVEAERAAQRFYLDLVPKAANKEARELFQLMAEQEEEHAQSIERLGQRVARQELPANANDNIAGVETMPGWRHADQITIEEALDLAISAEHSAALYYDAIADYFTGEAQRFFQDLSTCEEKHANLLVEMRERLNRAKN